MHDGNLIDELVMIDPRKLQAGTVADPTLVNKLFTVLGDNRGLSAASFSIERKLSVRTKVLEPFEVAAKDFIVVRPINDDFKYRSLVGNSVVYDPRMDGYPGVFQVTSDPIVQGHGLGNHERDVVMTQNLVQYHAHTISLLLVRDIPNTARLESISTLIPAFRSGTRPSAPPV